MWSRAIALWFDSWQANHGIALCFTAELRPITQTLCASIHSTLTIHTHKAERDLNEAKQVMCLEVCLAQSKHPAGIVIIIVVDYSYESAL